MCSIRKFHNCMWADIMTRKISMVRNLCMRIWKKKTVLTGIILYLDHGFMDNGHGKKLIALQGLVSEAIPQNGLKSCKKNGSISGSKDSATENSKKHILSGQEAINGKLIVHRRPK